MEKNRIYIIIFVLLFILVILLGTVNLFSSTKKNEQSLISISSPVTPTTNLVFPSNFPYVSPAVTSELAPSTTISSTKVITALELAYPLKYENLIIDYIQIRKQIIIFYPKEKQQAETVFKQFLNQYQTNEQEFAGMKIDYIGLTRDPNEPVPGSLLQ
ncbi:MAG: hypothetical protein HYW86_01195 [Candidatus Roizmanbacteria bacterium]|nr:MAG: hypothetical protein HYW86_01195 [Candidatus Roizmanbacteria bacterium]